MGDQRATAVARPTARTQKLTVEIVNGERELLAALRAEQLDGEMIGGHGSWPNLGMRTGR
jgi:hypothetical protein